MQQIVVTRRNPGLFCPAQGKPTDFAKAGTLITPSPDAGPISTTFNLGQELHHYGGVNSGLEPWIANAQETPKIIPSVTALTARTSLGHAVEVQRGAAKRGLLEIYAMAASNTSSSGVLDDQLRLIVESSHRVGLDHKLQEDAIKMSMIGVNSDRINALIRNAEITKNSAHELATYWDIAWKAYNLLDFKQKGANLAEAQWTRKQAEETARQGNIIMVFTKVTIIFASQSNTGPLPVSFLSSFFALEITEFPRDDEKELRFGPKWTLMYIRKYTHTVILVDRHANEVAI
ncbi:hypothetical protein PpBr36_04723 [Pyricularia pennisetigena]|uniref:hypothetical protein n=1 Tax=Pyricularia pennisetigena TaxID=1578925 RepID=UPI0011539803|nr:hypothetical protein PpBr36_04723 [Pyricularia pennisetigena]TLS26258.1 hypothetical protein PpBr36_04723 [Pyricularia pennisetigena]